MGGLLRANPVAIDDADGSGTRELAELLGAPIVAEAPWPTNGNWQSDLEAAQPLLDAARRAVEDGTRVFVGGSCNLAMATLPALCEAHPGLRVAWFDAHPDFNTPESSNSNFLGGMPLAHACGVWGTEAHPPGGLSPDRVHLVGIRDTDPGEALLLEAHHVHEGPPDTGPVYVHLDLDVLDPSLMPAAYAVSGGWTWEELEAALTDLPDLIGIEVTGCAPGHAQRVADTLARL